MSVDTIRNRQIKEVKDIWGAIQRQVFERQKKQVGSFQEQVAPRKTRDTDVEVNVERQVEVLTKITAEKMSSLESLIDFFQTQQTVGKDAGRRAFILATNPSDFLIAWNQLMRLYKTIGLSRTSQELIKVKLQDLTTPLDAINYGYSKLIEFLFKNRRDIEKDFVPVIQAFAVFRCARTQLSTQQYKVIEPIDIDTSYKEILGELSLDQREFIQNFLDKNYALGRQVLRQVPIVGFDEKSRTKALEDELGFPLPREYLRSLPAKQFGETLDKIKREGQSIRELKEHVKDLKTQLKQAEAEERQIRKAYEQEEDKIRTAAEQLRLVEDEKGGDPVGDQIRDLRDQLAELQTPSKSAKKQREKITKQIAELEAFRANFESGQFSLQLNTEIQDAEKQIGSLSARAEEVQQRIRSLQEQIEYNVDLIDELSGAISRELEDRVGFGKRFAQRRRDSSSSSSDSEDEMKSRFTSLRKRAVPFHSDRNEMYC